LLLFYQAAREKMLNSLFTNRVSSMTGGGGGDAVHEADHAHDFKTFYRTSSLYRLKATGGANDLFECAMIGLDDVVRLFTRSMFWTGKQPALPL
jgi:hypothetical protein